MRVLEYFSAPSSPFQSPNLPYALWQAPVQCLLAYMHQALLYLRRHTVKSKGDSIRVVCISDSHCNTLDLPKGDLLIHAGDLTNDGTTTEIQAQIDWLSDLPFLHVVVIAGNHDSYFDPRSRRSSDKGKSLDFKRLHYLQHSSTALEFPDQGGRRLTLYGAPQIPACGGDEMAFQYSRGEDAWTGTLPSDVDILVTHTPPKWHLDLPAGLGCEHLLKEVWKLKPKLHVFGHVHAGRGRETVYWNEGQQAYERLCWKSGWLCVLDPFLWMDVLRVLVHDVVGIAWDRLFGGESESTIMVNSGLVNFYGKRVHSAQYIDL